ncbi:hypothetical protein BDV41DRAFT_545925 [Aspergillus transmontanensis]|uniref:Uncharacterized protein n=1 Tax=Aspergillus transmontanensis TaxID=1034304 RepID=A0A5N6VNL7_9EURO|nr:hypothetical protein BDV41DRAFT_545925 [Aspergillus transmontanensis]
MEMDPPVWYFTMGAVPYFIFHRTTFAKKSVDLSIILVHFTTTHGCGCLIFLGSTAP